MVVLKVVVSGLMLGIWLAIAFLLFMFRPRALGNNRDHIGKPNNQV